MLDASIVHRVLSQATQAAQPILGLERWKINTRVEHISNGYCGTCERSTPYRLAWITLDPESFKSTGEEILETIVHELVHILISPTDGLVHAVKNCGVSESTANVLESARELAIERTVENVTYALKQLGIFERLRNACDYESSGSGEASRETTSRMDAQQ
jgi:hypothetical protein